MVSRRVKLFALNLANKLGYSVEQPSNLLKILKNAGFSFYEVKSENKNLEPVNEEYLLKQNDRINLFCKKE